MTGDCRELCRVAELLDEVVHPSPGIDVLLEGRVVDAEVRPRLGRIRVRGLGPDAVVLPSLRVVLVDTELDAEPSRDLASNVRRRQLVEVRNGHLLLANDRLHVLDRGPL